MFIDQTDKDVQTAITLLVNSFKMPLIRRIKIIEKYTKELVSFAVIKQKYWTCTYSYSPTTDFQSNPVKSYERGS